MPMPAMTDCLIASAQPISMKRGVDARLRNVSLAALRVSVPLSLTIRHSSAIRA